jgi:hypothetical protein
MIRALVIAVACARQWLVRARRPVLALVVAAALTGCDGSSGSGQRGSAFTFLSVDGFSLGGGGGTATVNSSINTATNTTACVTLRNNLKNPTITAPTALDNVIVQSYTVTLTAAGGGSLPGPFTFSTSALVPAGLVANNVLGGNTATVPVVLVPAGAKLDPRVRPPNRLPLLATAEVTFRGRNGRGSSVQAEGAVTVVFSVDAEATVTCAGTTPAPTPEPEPEPEPEPGT